MDSLTETPEGSPTGDPQAVLTALAERIAADVPPERREAVQAFAKAFVRRLSDEDLLATGPDGLFGVVSSAFAFADGKGTQASAVRVFNPSLERDGYTGAGSVIETNTDDSPFLVDSVNEELLARNLTVTRLLHRTEAGALRRNALPLSVRVTDGEVPSGLTANSRRV